MLVKCYNLTLKRYVSKVRTYANLKSGFGKLNFKLVLLKIFWNFKVESEVDFETVKLDLEILIKGYC